MKPVINLILMVTIVKTQKLTIGSTAFAPDGFIPAKYTCEGENVNPPLTIENIPSGTKSLAVIMEDPDAAGGIFDHWLIWNIKPQEMIVESLSSTGTEGKNSFGSVKYKGPCPPSGIHHYHFKVYALDKLLDIKAGSDKQTLQKAMKAHILAEGEIIGKYSKTNNK